MVDFDRPHQDQVEVNDPLEELLDGEDSEESDDEEENNVQQNEEEPDQEHTQQTVEYFPIVGSNWEMRYQEGLQKCYDLQVKKQREHEPENICDCNALKCEVQSGGQWYILGYCGKKKIPKLKSAICYHQAVSLEMCNLRRIWYPVISDFRFTAGINIVKMGRWEKDDHNNRYNSHIAM